MAHPLFMLILSMLMGCFGGHTSHCQEPEDTCYTVVKGDIGHTIASKYSGVDALAISLANQDYLEAEYERRCGGIEGDVGAYVCNPENEKYRLINSLWPGMVLKIPEATPTPEMVEAIKRWDGKRVAIVIDDTGSMGDNRRATGILWNAAVNQSGGKVTGIYTYADGKVQKFTNTSTVELNVTGHLENTYQALWYAENDSNPDMIVLISDESGDDWDWERRFFRKDVEDLPQIIAHCLEDGGEMACEQNFRRLVAATGGQYYDHQN